MSTPNEGIAKFLESIARDLFSRVIRGAFDFERDMLQLHKLLEQSRSIQAVPVELQVLNTIAVLMSVSGDFKGAATQFKELYERYAQLNDLNGMVTALNNQAVALQIMGKTSQSLQSYDEALEKVALSDTPGYQIVSYGQAVTGKMSQLVQAGRLEDAELLFQTIQQIANDYVEHNRYEYGRTMMYGYQHLAEIALERADFEKALSNYNLAIELARSGSVHHGIGSIEMTRAFIELAWHGAEAAAPFWKIAEAAIDSTDVVGGAATHYLAVARQLARTQHKEQSEYFARRALNLFEQHAVEQGIQMVREEFPSVVQSGSLTLAT